jgi:hypothetical protein
MDPPPPPPPQLPPVERPGKPGLLGTGIFVGCLAGGFAGVALSDDGKWVALFGALTFACIVAGTVMVAMGVSSSKAGWAAVGSLLGFILLAGVGFFAGCLVLMSA